MNKKTITIYVKNGCIQDVDNPYPDIDIKIRDYDTIDEQNCFTDENNQWYSTELY